MVYLCVPSDIYDIQSYHFYFRFHVIDSENANNIL